MEQAIVPVTRPLTSLERELLIESVGNAVFLKKQSYKKQGAPETLEEVELCRAKIQEIQAVEDLKVAIQDGRISITVPDTEVVKELPTGTKEIDDGSVIDGTHENVKEKSSK